jgi:hypothetical protein
LELQFAFVSFSLLNWISCFMASINSTEALQDLDSMSASPSADLLTPGRVLLRNSALLSQLSELQTQHNQISSRISVCVSQLQAAPTEKELGSAAYISLLKMGLIDALSPLEQKVAALQETRQSALALLSIDLR